MKSKHLSMLIFTGCLGVILGVFAFIVTTSPNSSVDAAMMVHNVNLDL